MSNSETAATAGEEARKQAGQDIQHLGVPAVEANGNTKPQQNGGETETADTNHGFTRQEMLSESLVGSVRYYERHVFLSCKSPESWPSNVEAAGSDPLPNRLAAALKARGADLPKKTRLTVCEECDGPDSSSGDVLIFPEMVRYKGLTHVDVDTFVEDALVNGKEWAGSTLESLSGSHIFVCSHGSRDRRCGTCGPVLIEKLNEEIKLRGLDGEIFVRACSHVGGHKYAGNVIVFSSSDTGAVSGHWYGYVAPADVPLILDVHIGRGEIIDRLWRGQMGVNEGDQKLAQQSRLGGLQVDGNGCACSESPDQAENGVKGGSGSACCQSSEPALKEDKEIPNHLVSSGSSTHDGHMIFYDDSDTEEEPVDPRIPLWGPYYIPLPKWVDTWEREDTNAALAVLGAAAAVAVAIRVCIKSL